MSVRGRDESRELAADWLKEKLIAGPTAGALGRDPGFHWSESC